MAEIIYLREIDRARRRPRSHVRERQTLERAVAILKDNLREVAGELADAPHAAQPELLDRIENLAAMIRYALRMLGDIPPEPGLNHPLSVGS